jgi:hypothetical protein
VRLPALLAAVLAAVSPPVGPRLNALHLPPLPPEGLIARAPQGAVLVALDGRVIGHLPGYTPQEWRFSSRRSPLLRDRRNRVFRLDRVARRLRPARFPRLPIDNGECRRGPVASKGRILLCVGPPSRVLIQAADGRTRPLFPAARPERFDRHWQAALLSPDGRTLLLEASVPCDTSLAFLVGLDGRRPRLALGDGGCDDGSTVAVGWTRSGLAVVAADNCTCIRDGTYLVQPRTGRRRFLYGARGELWS